MSSSVSCCAKLTIVVSDLFKGAGKTFRIAGQKNTRSIGEIFSFSRDRQTDQCRSQRRENRNYKSDDQNQRPARIIIIVSAVSSAKKNLPATPNQP